MNQIKTTILTCGFAVALGACAANIDAATLEIQLIDVDIEYDSTSGEVTSLGPGADPLSAVFFFVDDAAVGSLEAPGDDISVDINVPGVFSIDPAGDVVTSATGGVLELLTPGLSLELSLDEVEVVYTPVVSGPSSFEFIFLGGVSDVTSQALPLGLVIGDTVSVTISTQSTSLTTGTDVEAFTATGTGELTGALIPEPSTLGLLAAMSLVPTAARKR